MSFRIIEGDCLARLADIPDRSVQTCVTSPPYWGLRDYGAEGQLGLEPTPEHYVENMVAVFREVRRVLRDDGTLWLNLGDSYANLGHYKGNPGDVGNIGKPQVADVEGSKAYRKASNADFAAAGLKNKDLVGIPWMVAFALRADGWYLRSDIIWAKTNPMPESVTDRPTRAHEQIFLLTKQRRYSYDADAIREPATYEGPNGTQLSPYAQGFGRRTPEQEAERRVKRRTVRPGIDTNRRRAGNGAMSYPAHSRNKRSVWTVATQPFPGAHFATFPPKLIEPCVLAGSAEGDTVLDPFAGAGTTGLVTLRHNREFIGIELNPDYAQMARDRIHDDAPLLNTEARA